MSLYQALRLTSFLSQLKVNHRKPAAFLDNRSTIRMIRNSELAGMRSPLLDGKNFQSWAELVKIVLELRGFKKTLESDEVDPGLDLEASLIILDSMDGSHKAQERRLNSESHLQKLASRVRR